MYAKTYGAAISGIEGHIITVEVDIATGLPIFDIVGLPTTSVKEARERVRAALTNSGYEFPMRRIVVNLAPADLRKDGSALDLAIAMGVIIASGQLKLSKEKKEKLCRDTLFVGELSLEGKIRPVTGLLAMALSALEKDIKFVATGQENAREAVCLYEESVISAPNLSILTARLEGTRKITPSGELIDKMPKEEAVSKSEEHIVSIANEYEEFNEGIECFKSRECKEYKHMEEKDFRDVRGQFMAKRALEISAAGFHNVMMVGPPGSGKTMLAERLPGIMPTMTREEMLEVSKIASVAGTLEQGYLQEIRPFRKPHHTITMAGMAGGGTMVKPGEVTLAHKGVLFLDETPEFRREVVEVLRQPLESGEIHIARANGSVSFPAEFLLIIALNPCPCGFLGDANHICTCKPSEIARYRRRLSGPMLDRIDLCVEVKRPEYIELSQTEPDGESSITIRERIERVRAIQNMRFSGSKTQYNGQMMPGEVEKFCGLSSVARELLKEFFMSFHMSARAYSRILKVARTIADLDGAEQIEEEHIAEAVSYRNGYKQTL